MKGYDRLIAALAAVALLAAGTAQAALKKNADNVSSDPRAAFNPNAAAGDLALPMPGGLQMVFRAVAIPAGNALYDKKFRMGVNDVDEDRALYERRIDGYVGAPFVTENLPRAWQRVLPADERRGFNYYFIGKYEITNAQWAAVMGTPLEGRADGNYYVDLTDSTADTLFRSNYEEERRRQTIDNINIFYVALTRPIYGLKVIAANPPHVTTVITTSTAISTHITNRKSPSPIT